MSSKSNTPASRTGTPVSTKRNPTTGKVVIDTPKHAAQRASDAKIAAPRQHEKIKTIVEHNFDLLVKPKASESEVKGIEGFKLLIALRAAVN
ncbi:hypothetical protein LTR27_003828 [Elasticomyces elasticus]|nr:hypothetical protein LTR27_003828 [Elasticomyces elasticus]